MIAKSQLDIDFRADVGSHAGKGSHDILSIILRPPRTPSTHQTRTSGPHASMTVAPKTDVRMERLLALCSKSSQEPWITPALVVCVERDDSAELVLASEHPLSRGFSSARTTYERQTKYRLLLKASARLSEVYASFSCSFSCAWAACGCQGRC